MYETICIRRNANGDNNRLGLGEE